MKNIRDKVPQSIWYYVYVCNLASNLKYSAGQKLILARVESEISQENEYLDRSCCREDDWIWQYLLKMGEKNHGYVKPMICKDIFKSFDLALLEFFHF